MAILTTIIDGVTELSAGVKRTPILFPLVREDDLAHTFRIACTVGGEALPLDGATITGKFARADGLVVPLTGMVEGGCAIVTLSAACYRVGGAFALVIKATLDGVTSSIYLTDGHVFSPGGDTMVDSGETALSLEALFNRLEAGVAAVEESANIAAQAAQDAQVALGGADAVQRAEEAAEAVEDALERLQNVDTVQLVAELDALRTAVTPATLWAGDWASGSIEVQNIGKWRLLDIQTGLGHVLGVNDGTSIRAFGVLGNGGNHITVNLSMTVAGEDVTLAINSRYTHSASGSHGSDNTTTIKAITGLVMMEGAA